ncbi:MAG: DUF2971 domain-containing protein, partial [Candidatus Pacebacteria bacterium]|nr:DUF2971 domain-containing protein [Candidatus Paceibacterota bacterium]
ALYKYLAPCRAAQILRDLRIRFSQVSVLNDVDEFLPPYKGFATREKAEEVAREFLPFKYPEEYAEVYRNLPKDQADQLINEKVREGADNLEESFQEGKIGRDLYAKLDCNFGMLSLSATLTSKLMWSFYSDGGRGIVIEFDTSHAWFNNKTAYNGSFRRLRKVLYVADREPTYFLSAKDNEVLYTKTLEWEFEDEWRIIRGFNGGQKAPKQDPYGKDVFLFDIPPFAIQTVVFGYRTTSENEKALRKIVIANENLKHIVFRRAVRNVDGKIEIVSDGIGIL